MLQKKLALGVDTGTSSRRRGSTSCSSATRPEDPRTEGVPHVTVDCTATATASHDRRRIRERFARAATEAAAAARREVQKEAPARRRPGRGEIRRQSSRRRSARTFSTAPDDHDACPPAARGGIEGVRRADVRPRGGEDFRAEVRGGSRRACWDAHAARAWTGLLRTPFRRAGVRGGDEEERGAVDAIGTAACAGPGRAGGGARRCRRNWRPARAARAPRGVSPDAGRSSGGWASPAVRRRARRCDGHFENRREPHVNVRVFPPAKSTVYSSSHSNRKKPRLSTGTRTREQRAWTSPAIRQWRVIAITKVRFGVRDTPGERTPRPSPSTMAAHAPLTGGVLAHPLSGARRSPVDLARRARFSRPRAMRQDVVAPGGAFCGGSPAPRWVAPRGVRHRASASSNAPRSAEGARAFFRRCPPGATAPLRPDGWRERDGAPSLDVDDFDDDQYRWSDAFAASPSMTVRVRARPSPPPPPRR